MGGAFAGLAAGAVIGTAPASAVGVSRDVLRPARISDADRLAWVWNFREDGHPHYVRHVRANHNLGIMLKTHDGASWMRGLSISDDDRNAVDRIGRIGAFFEDAGVPFHCWAVAGGEDPRREAEMAQIVTSAGARGLVLDLESHDGFWAGTPEDATTFVRHLRRLRRDTTISLTIDPRAWEVERLPLAEFAPVTRDILPQTYWDMFASQGDIDGYARAGYDPGPAGLTPRFVVDVTTELLEPFGYPLAPIGDGTVTDRDAWAEFMAACSANCAERISVWRLGVTSADVLSLLKRPRDARVRHDLPQLHRLLSASNTPYPFAP
ncbi:MAG: hypothetical protein O3B31_13870 [Chloroflexi bacterium]|nr:hypothetical protein [Chloroflexota bacterium]MDA1004410.1 hypothetical protein [Chloroflexota bacterium]